MFVKWNQMKSDYWTMHAVCTLYDYLYDKQSLGGSLVSLKKYFREISCRIWKLQVIKSWTKQVVWTIFVHKRGSVTRALSIMELRK